MEALNPKAIVPGNRWVIVNRTIHRPVESHADLENALRARDILNDHEIENARPACFGVIDTHTGSVIN